MANRKAASRPPHLRSPAGGAAFAGALVVTAAVLLGAAAAGAQPCPSSNDTCGAVVLKPDTFPRIHFRAFPGVVGSQGQDSTVSRKITLTWERDTTVEKRLIGNPAAGGFGGYSIYRVFSSPDTCRLELIRRYVYADTLLWHFPTYEFLPRPGGGLDTVLTTPDPRMTFVDPDSAGNLVKRCRHYDINGNCASRGDSVFVLVPPPPPPNGYATYYAIVYAAAPEDVQGGFEDLFVPDIAHCRQNAPLSALDFAGADVSFGPAPSLDLGAFTIECWFRRDGPGTTTTTGIGGVTDAIPLVTKGRDEGEGSDLDMNWFLGIRKSDGRLFADFEEGADGPSPGLNHPLVGATPITLGEWHHAAATYDGDRWELYLDGGLDSELVVGRPPQSASIQYAGLATAFNSTGIADGSFDGALDEVRVWNYARSRQAIRDSMRLEITTPAPGLVARWGFDEAAGTEVHGSAGTSVNGVVQGTAFDWIPDALGAYTCCNINNLALNLMKEPVFITGPPTANLEQVYVVPNPYRGSEPWDQPGTHRIQVRNIPTQATVRFYTVAGDLVREIDFHSVVSGAVDWDLKNGNGRDVASGIYVVRVTTPQGFEVRKHFVIVR